MANRIVQRMAETEFEAALLERYSDQRGRMQRSTGDLKESYTRLLDLRKVDLAECRRLLEQWKDRATPQQQQRYRIIFPCESAGCEPRGLDGEPIDDDDTRRHLAADILEREGIVVTDDTLAAGIACAAAQLQADRDAPGLIEPPPVPPARQLYSSDQTLLGDAASPGPGDRPPERPVSDRSAAPDDNPPPEVPSAPQQLPQRAEPPLEPEPEYGDDGLRRRSPYRNSFNDKAKAIARGEW